MKKFIFALGCMLCSFAFADVAELNTLLQNFTSLKANFSEMISDNQGNQSNATGILYIKKPNQFRWEAATPNEELFISNGQKVWNVEPDLEQVTISPLTKNLSTTPLLLLSGNTKDLSTVFSIKQQDATHYILTPKDQDSMIQQIVLGFDSKGVVSTLEITNTMGQVSQLQLSNVLLNQNLPTSLFTYTPEKGMDVLTQ